LLAGSGGMARPKGWGERIYQAILGLGVKRKERITYGTFGELVAKAEQPPRKKPYSPQTVAAWIEERGEPSIAAFAAMAKVCGLPEAWLPFGAQPEAPLLPMREAKPEAEREVKKPARRRA
jgi:hypothetical protein